MGGYFGGRDVVHYRYGRINGAPIDATDLSPIVSIRAMRVKKERVYVCMHDRPPWVVVKGWEDIITANFMITICFVVLYLVKLT